MMIILVTWSETHFISQNTNHKVLIKVCSFVVIRFKILGDDLNL